MESVRRLTHAAAFATLVCVPLVSGCGSGRHATQPGPTAVSKPASGSPAPSMEAASAALVAYRGMWAAFVEAGKTSDPDAPDLRKYADDKALKAIVSSLYTNRDQKKVILGDLVIDPKVSAAIPNDAPTEVSIVDCVNDEKWLVYKASGGLVNDIPGGKHRTTATVKRTEGVWKVSSFALEGAGTC